MVSNARVAPHDAADLRAFSYAADSIMSVYERAVFLFVWREISILGISGLLQILCIYNILDRFRIIYIYIYSQLHTHIDTPMNADLTFDDFRVLHRKILSGNLRT